MLKAKVGAPAAVIAIAALGIICYFLYRHSFGGNPYQKPITAANAPQYAKDMMKNGRTSNYFPQGLPGRQ